MRRFHHAFALWVACATALCSCSAILGFHADQCKTDADCQGIMPGARCDTAQRLCVAPPEAGFDAPAEEPPADSLESGEPADAGLDGDVADDVFQGCPEPDADTYDGSGDPCNASDKPEATINSDITEDFTLDCKRDYVLQGIVFVQSGATLTIPAGTTVKGDPQKRGTLVIQPGGKLVATGTEHRPVVFTSGFDPELRQPGNWGGVIVLGRAPITRVAGQIVPGTIQGIPIGSEFGGSDEDDSSGRLEYVRIEYPGIRLDGTDPSSRQAGLTLAGVGRGTVVHHVQVRMPGASCFSVRGGTVDLAHVACQMNNWGTHGITWSDGWVGRLQFGIVQVLHDAGPGAPSADNFALFGRNDAAGTTSTPRSAPSLYNLSLCGAKTEYAGEQYGIVAAGATKGSMRNAIVTGFEAGWDVRDNGTVFDLRNSIFFDNIIKPIAYEENGSNTTTQADDDASFDEIATFSLATNGNSQSDPGIGSCRSAEAPDFRPAQPLTANAASPPDDGFFTPAPYVGAVDACGTWPYAPWLVWSAK